MSVKLTGSLVGLTTVAQNIWPVPTSTIPVSYHRSICRLCACEVESDFTSESINRPNMSAIEIVSLRFIVFLPSRMIVVRGLSVTLIDEHLTSPGFFSAKKVQLSDIQTATAAPAHLPR